MVKTASLDIDTLDFRTLVAKVEDTGHNGNKVDYYNCSGEEAFRFSSLEEVNMYPTEISSTSDFPLQKINEEEYASILKDYKDQITKETTIEVIEGPTTRQKRKTWKF